MKLMLRNILSFFIYLISILLLSFLGGFYILSILNLKKGSVWYDIVPYIMVIAILLITYFFSEILKRQKKKSIFSKRESLTLDEIYTRFYSDSDLSKNLVQELWRELAEALHLPIDKLLPTDEFSDKLGISNDEIEDLEEKIFFRLEGTGKEVDYSKIITIDDYIHQIGSIVESSNPNPIQS